MSAWLATTVMVAVVVFSLRIWAHGFHGAALLESSVAAWENKVRRNIGLPLSFESGTGNVQDLLNRPIGAPHGNAPELAPASPQAVEATVQELVSYLIYMEAKNILSEEFPNFPMDQIPQFRSRAVRLLGDIGPAALADVLSAKMDVSAGGQPGVGGAPARFQNPYFDPTLVVSSQCLGDLEKAEKLIVTACSLSAQAFTAAQAALSPLLAGDDPKLRAAAQDAMKQMNKLLPINVLLDLAGGGSGDALKSAMASLKERLAAGELKLTLADYLRVVNVVKSNPNPNLLTAASRILERCPEQTAGPLVRYIMEELKTTPNPGVLKLGLIAAVRASEEDSLSLMQQAMGLLRSGPSPDVLKLASRLAERRVGEANKGVLLALMKQAVQEQNESLKALGVSWLLTHSPSSCDPETLSKAMEDPDSEIGINTWESLARNDLGEQVSSLIRSRPDLLHKALRTRTPSSRAAAVKISGRLRVREAVPDVIELLTDPDTEVFGAATEALPMITRQFLGPEAFEKDINAKREAQRKWRAWWDAQGKK